MDWQLIETLEPYKTVFLYHDTDLFPVVGFKVGDDGEMFILWEGGPEDGEHLEYPLLKYAPTHWKLLDDMSTLPGRGP